MKNTSSDQILAAMRDLSRVTGCRWITFIGGTLLLVSGCAPRRDSTGILKLPPPASFPDCTYYGYAPTCWNNWQPGWNCCPLPATEVITEPATLEAVPAPKGVDANAATSKSQSPPRTAPPAAQQPKRPVYGPIPPPKLSPAPSSVGKSPQVASRPNQGAIQLTSGVVPINPTTPPAAFSPPPARLVPDTVDCGPVPPPNKR